MTSIQKQIVYGLASIVGLCATWYYNIQFITQNKGSSTAKFVTDNYVNAASASIANDLIVVVFVFFFWSFLEARKWKMRFWWLYVIGTFLGAIACTFPLFLCMRERRMAQVESEQST